MCMVEIYRGDPESGEKLWEDVSEYEIDLEAKELRAVNIMGEERTFPLSEQLRWNEAQDILMI